MRIESPTQKKIKQREKSIIEAAIVHIEQSGFGSLTSYHLQEIYPFNMGRKIWQTSAQGRR